MLGFFARSDVTSYIHMSITPFPKISGRPLFVERIDLFTCITGGVRCRYQQLTPPAPAEPSPATPSLAMPAGPQPATPSLACRALPYRALPCRAMPDHATPCLPNPAVPRPAEPCHACRA